MHPCLNVDEIVRLIACELVTSGRKATAVCLACCSRSLQEPVLDVLWATQAELSPLFKCFPGDVWNEGGYTVSSTPTTRLFLFPHRFGSKVFQTTPDGDRMGPFPEVRSKNAGAQRPWHPENSVFGGLFRHPTLHNQRAFAPKSDNSRFAWNRGIVSSVPPIVPFPQYRFHLFRILCKPCPPIHDRFGDHKLAYALPQLARYNPPFLASRPDDHHRCFQDVFRHQPKCAPEVSRGFSIDKGGQRSDLQITEPTQSVGGHWEGDFNTLGIAAESDIPENRV